MVLLLAFTLTGYTLAVIGVSALWTPDVWWQSILVWFVGAVVVHDLIVFPLYAAVDRALSRVLRIRRRADQVQLNQLQNEVPSVSAMNFVRIPLMAAALTFAIFFPGILSRGEGSYVAATGQNQDPFLERWLLLSAITFSVAAAAYAWRLLRRRHATTATAQEDTFRATTSNSVTDEANDP